MDPENGMGPVPELRGPRTHSAAGRVRVKNGMVHHPNCLFWVERLRWRMQFEDVSMETKACRRGLLMCFGAVFATTDLQRMNRSLDANQMAPPLYSKRRLTIAEQQIPVL